MKAFYKFMWKEVIPFWRIVKNVVSYLIYRTTFVYDRNNMEREFTFTYRVSVIIIIFCTSLNQRERNDGLE